MSITSSLQRGLRRVGIEVRRNPYTDPITLQRALLPRENPLILDIGAHVGTTYTRYREAFPAATIHAFEPFPDAYAALSARVGDDPRAETHPLALGAVPGRATLHINAASATNSLLEAEAAATLVWGQGVLDERARLEVEVTTLDAFATAHALDRIDIAKIDVQGHEHAVLEGAGALLGTRRIGILCFEVILASTYTGQRPLEDHLALMRGHGYTLVDLLQPIRRHGRLLQMDLLFTVPELVPDKDRPPGGNGR